MKAIVVYESLWGNTAALAKAIAEGLGKGTQALSTAQATAASLKGADLLVVGAPVLGFRAPSDQMLRMIDQSREKVPPDLSQPSIRTWLAGLPEGKGRCVAFESRIWWSPGGSIGGIESGLKTKGYPPLAKAQKFIVTGKYGPLREGELERAKQWGAELAKLAG